MEGNARLYNCARCQSQVIICSDCDRGNIYCLSCSSVARAESIRKASLRYQNSQQGKFNHAARQKQYRLRLKQKVTHQGSIDLAPDDVLDLTLNEQHQLEDKSVNRGIRCHFCQKNCSNFLRIGFLKNYLGSCVKILKVKGGNKNDRFNRNRRKNLTLLSCREVAYRDNCPSIEYSP